MIESPKRAFCGEVKNLRMAGYPRRGSNPADGKTNLAEEKPLKCRPVWVTRHEKASEGSGGEVLPGSVRGKAIERKNPRRVSDSVVG